MQVLTPILSNLIRHPLRPYVVDDRRTWKGLHLYVGALHLARAIERATDRPHVAFMLPTSGAGPLAMLATWMLGRTTVPLNYLLKREDRAYICRDAEIDTVLTARPMLEMFGDLPDGVKPLFVEDLKPTGVPPLRRAARRPDDHLACLMYTSGTSGRPKGVMLTAGNLAANVEQARRFTDFRRGDRMLGVIPQFHSFGFTVLTLVPLTLNLEVVFTARFMPGRMIEMLRTHRPTVLVLIPSMYNALLAQKKATKEDFASLRWVVSGGEPLPEAVADGFRERFGVTINEGYGLTETSPATNICPPTGPRAKSVGPPLPDIEQRIVGPDETPVGPGGEGEIRMRGPNIMQGYYKLPDETSQVFDADGFFRTGDMGRQDPDGYLYITGRIKEMLIVGGENVFPREIEEVLNAHPAVHASAVVGLPDPMRGEVPLAFVEMAEDAAFDATQLRSHCREHLPPYKVPREIRRLDELPRNATGKILRRELTPETASSDAAAASATADAGNGEEASE